MSIKNKLTVRAQSLNSVASISDLALWSRTQFATHDFNETLSNMLKRAVLLHASTDQLHELLATIWAQDTVWVEGKEVNVKIEKLSVNRELRMPCYNYIKPGSVMTMGHLWPNRNMVLNPILADIISAMALEKVSTMTDGRLALAIMDASMAFQQRQEKLETIRYDGPWDILE